MGSQGPSHDVANDGEFHQGLGSAVIATALLLQLFPLPFVIARIYVCRRLRRVCVEDVFAYLAWLTTVVHAALIGTNAKIMARHWKDVEESQVPNISYRLNIVCIVYALSGGLAKTSVFLQLKTFFAPGPMRDAAWWVITISLIANAMAYTTIMMLYLLTCLPREKIWHADVKGRCMDWDGVSIAVGILNTMSDIETFLVPVWCVLRLHTDIWTKIGALAVFASGALTAIIGLLGMCWRLRVLKGGDYTWLLSELSLICMAELTMVIVTAGCPLLKNALRLSLRDQTRPRYPVLSPPPTAARVGKLTGSDTTNTTETVVSKTQIPATSAFREGRGSRDAMTSLALHDVYGDLSVNGSKSQAAELEERTLGSYLKDF